MIKLCRFGWRWTREREQLFAFSLLPVVKRKNEQKENSLGEGRLLHLVSVSSSPRVFCPLFVVFVVVVVSTQSHSANLHFAYCIVLTLFPMGEGGLY